MINIFFKTLSQEGVLSRDYKKLLQTIINETDLSSFQFSNQVNTTFTEFLNKLSKYLSSYNIDIDTLMSLSEEHLENTPSKIEPSLSIYDILRYNIILGSSCNDYFLIKGSLTGIQKYIYDVNAEGALKNLRGRSYYMSILMDSVVEYLLTKLSLTNQSVLYNSGGTFCIIAPHNKNSESIYQQAKMHIANSIFDLHNTELVILTATKVSKTELLNNSVKVFDKLQALKSQAKNAPLCDIALDRFNQIFEPQHPTNSQHISHIELGKHLNRVKYVAINNHHSEEEALISINPGNIGLYFHLLDHIPVSLSLDSRLVIYNYNFTEYCFPYSCRCKFIAGIGIDNLSFSELIANDSSLKRLGVLRMDVDNLGNTLKNYNTDKFGIARYAKMSRKLDTFFKKKLNEIWKTKHCNNSVIVYSGGDDLFIAGEWLCILNFAHDIKTAFTEFFKDNTITLSGGIALVPPKFPIIRAAEYSADEESNAKAFSFNGENKNALSIFGIALRWDKEFKWVLDYANEMTKLIKQNNDTYHPIIRRLINYALNVKFKNGTIQPARQVWISTYDLSRMAERRKECKSFIKRCINDITTGKTLAGQPIHSPYHALQLLSTAARITELKSRTNQ